MNVVLFVLGLMVVVFTSAGVLFTIMLPREPRGFERLPLLVNRVVQWAFIGVARPARTCEGKDALLAPVAPTGSLVLVAGRSLGGAGRRRHAPSIREGALLDVTAKQEQPANVAQAWVTSVTG